MNPEPIFKALSGYRVTAALRTAVEMDLFTAIAEGKRTAADLAAERGGTERSIRILLDALAANAPQVLRKAGPRYGLTPVSRKYLVSTGPMFVGPLAGLFAHPTMWDAYRDLTAAVKAGTSVLAKNAHAPGQPFWEEFARATALEAAVRGRKIVRMLGKLPDPCLVLDLACGSGAYGAAFAKEVPGAKVTLFDQAYVLAETRKLVREPVRFMEGDLFTTDFEGPYDVIVASHVFHHYNAWDCSVLAKKVAGALAPGGRLVIQEFMPDERRSKAAAALLFAVTMLVWTHDGDAYTFGEYKKWLAAAGLTKVTFKPFLPPADLILAVKG